MHLTSSLSLQVYREIMFFRAHSYLSELATDLVLVFACHVGLVVGCLLLSAVQNFTFSSFPI